jgi:hypothetical protein
MHLGSPFLNIGQITDVLQSVGISSLRHIIDIRLNFPSVMLGPPSFSNSAQIRSSPAALLFLSNLIIDSISALFGSNSSFLKLLFVDSPILHHLLLGLNWVRYSEVGQSTSETPLLYLYYLTILLLLHSIRIALLI